MALLPPWVGEVNVHASQRPGGQPRQRDAGVLVEYASARAQAVRLQLVVHDGGPLAPNLEADHAKLRHGGQPLEQEAPTPGADLELDRETWLDQLRQLDLVCLG